MTETKFGVVLYKSTEEAHLKHPYFRIEYIKISNILARIISEYMREKDLITWSRQNKRKTSNNTYALNFCLRHYFLQPNSYYLLTGEGHVGAYKNTYNDRLPALRERTPSLDEMYYFITRKYPQHIISMKYVVGDKLPTPSFGSIKIDFTPKN